MASNDQMTRQWVLLQTLEKGEGATIEMLARALSQDYACHLRTIRHDLQAPDARFRPTRTVSTARCAASSSRGAASGTPAKRQQRTSKVA